MSNTRKPPRYEPTKDLALARDACSPERVIALCSHVLEQEPRSVTAYLLRGRSWFSVNRPKEGLRDFSQALAIDSTRTRTFVRDSVQASSRVSDSLLTLVRERTTVSLVSSASVSDGIAGNSHLGVQQVPTHDRGPGADPTEHTPTNPTPANGENDRTNAIGAPFVLADTLADSVESKAHEDSLWACLQETERSPEDAWAHLCVGRAYYKKKDYEQARAFLTRALDLNNRLVEAYILRAKAVGARGHYRKALRDINRALGITPDHAAAYAARAWVHHCLGRSRKELADLRRALSLEYEKPDFLRVRIRLIQGQ